MNGHLMLQLAQLNKFMEQDKPIPYPHIVHIDLPSCSSLVISLTRKLSLSATYHTPLLDHLVCDIKTITTRTPALLKHKYLDWKNTECKLWIENLVVNIAGSRIAGDI